MTRAFGVLAQHPEYHGNPTLCQYQCPVCTTVIAYDRTWFSAVASTLLHEQGCEVATATHFARRGQCHDLR